MKPLIRDIEAGGEPDFETMLKVFAPHVPRLLDLESTPQDPRWHAEGDVAIHTEMVMQEVYALLRDNGADPQTRVTTVLAGLLHDIGKTTTTKTAEIDGEQRIVAPRHAAIGRHDLAYRICDWPLDPKVRTSLLALVGHHHDWRKLVAQKCTSFDFTRFSFLVDPSLLSDLEWCDVSGRTCSDKIEQLDQVTFFRDLWAEHKTSQQSLHDFQTELFAKLDDQSERAKGFVVARASHELMRGIVFTADEAWSRSFSYRKAFSHLVVMNGPSGCGKTTYARNHFSNYEIISLDAIRQELTGDARNQSKNGEVRQLAKTRLKRALAAKADVVWDATTMRRDFRRVPIQLGFDYGAHVELLVAETTLANCLKRNSDRDREVPVEIVRRQVERAEYPTCDEAHTVSFFGSSDHEDK